MNVKKFCLSKTKNLKEAMRIIDVGGYGIALVVDGNKHLLGVVTDSDIRRALLQGISLETPVKEVMNTNPVTIEKENTKEDILPISIQDKLYPYGSMVIPVVNKNKVVESLVVATKKGIVSKAFNYEKNKPVRRVLVVGGAGYVGSLLCEKLLRKGYKVRILDNLMYGADGIKPIFYHSNLEFVYGDVRDMEKVMDSIKGVDAVIHLAAIVGDPASALNPKETIESNYFATKMLAEMCKYSQINRFIFASTCSVYGAAVEGKMLTEESSLNPVSLYAEMKLKSEQGILELEDENFSPTILRKATLYGKSYRMRFDLVVNILTIKALKENKFEIFGGNQYRALCHVSDVVDAYVKCLEAPIEKVKGQVFNIVTENMEIVKIGEIVHKLIPNSKMVVVKDAKDIRNYCVDGSKIKKVLLFNGGKSIKDGIEEIKAAVKKGLYADHKDPKYSNVDFLRCKNENKVMYEM